MSEQVGAAAGKVWEYLKLNGAVTAGQVQKGTALDTVLTNQALGWLAREGKLKIDRSKRVAVYSLAE